MIKRCGPPVAMDTVANMPGNRLRLELRTVARTWTFRVAGSTFGSIELISPINCSPAKASVLSVTFCFGTIFPSDFCGA